MRLSAVDAPAQIPSTIPDALTQAVHRRGHGPAVSVLSEAGRAEQGVASLAQWAAKGAHLLAGELDLKAGDTLGIDLPPSWTAAAVCLAAWWVGLVVDPHGEVDVVVCHERHGRRGRVETLWVGDAIDGGPIGHVDGEEWPQAVQSFPDAPPPPRVPGGPALRHRGEVHTQQELLAEMASTPAGTAGIEVGRTPARMALLAVAVRPLVAARPTVVLDGVGRDAAHGDRVRVWL